MWLGIPYDYLEGLSVRQQRILVKARVTELIKRKNEEIRKVSRSPTKPIDTQTNTRLFIKQLSKAKPYRIQVGGDPLRAQSVIDKALQFNSKPSTGIESEFADLSTTIGKNSEGDTDSPTLKGRGIG